MVMSAGKGLWKIGTKSTQIFYRSHIMGSGPGKQVMDISPKTSHTSIWWGVYKTQTTVFSTI
jgi:hypothetical protein